MPHSVSQVHPARYQDTQVQRKALPIVLSRLSAMNSDIWQHGLVRGRRILEFAQHAKMPHSQHVPHHKCFQEQNQLQHNSESVQTVTIGIVPSFLTHIPQAHILVRLNQTYRALENQAVRQVS